MRVDLDRVRAERDRREAGARQEFGGTDTVAPAGEVTPIKQVECSGCHAILQLDPPRPGGHHLRCGACGTTNIVPLVTKADRAAKAGVVAGGLTGAIVGAVCSGLLLAVLGTLILGPLGSVIGGIIGLSLGAAGGTFVFGWLGAGLAVLLSNERDRRGLIVVGVLLVIAVALQLLGGS